MVGIIDAVHDETACSSICQHPGCWASQRRVVRGIPHTPRSTNPKSIDTEEYTGLPTQKIINLLADYGEDPRDRYSNQAKPTPDTDRRTVTYSSDNKLPSGGHVNSKESLTRIPAPQSSPISYHSRPMVTSGQVRNVLDPHTRSIGKVEVQEVFDIDDLSRTWPETFIAKKYYVWIPNAKRKKRLLEPLGNTPMGKLASGPNTVSVKDKTEEMIPKEIERSRQQKGIKLEKRGRKSPIGAHISHSSPPPGGRYVRPQVFSEVSNIPKDVLDKIIAEVELRGSIEDQRFVEMAGRYWPGLERDPTSLSLLSNDLLKQKKINIIDKQVQPTHTQAEYYDKDNMLEELQSLPDVSPDSRPIKETSPRRAFNPKEPLPKIASQSQTSMSRVLLGLPEIPSGQRVTKTFTYKRDQQFDFMLEPNTANDPSHMIDGVQITTKTQQPVQGDDSVPIHAVSPTYSTNVPRPPRVTPAGTSPGTVQQPSITDTPSKYEGDSGEGADRGTTVQLSPRPPSSASMGAGGPPPITAGPTAPTGTGVETFTQPHPPGSLPTQERASALRRSTARGSQRNVRFAVDVPPQPPSTPDQPFHYTTTTTTTTMHTTPQPPPHTTAVIHGRPVQPVTTATATAGGGRHRQQQHLGAASMIVNYTESVADNEGLVVVGHGQGGGAGSSGAVMSKPYTIGPIQSISGPGRSVGAGGQLVESGSGSGGVQSPDSWPQIQEEDFARRTPPSSGISKHSQSITHTIPTAEPPTESEETKSPPYMVEAESPAPPPPSPEPTGAPNTQQLRHSMPPPPHTHPLAETATHPSSGTGAPGGGGGADNLSSFVHGFTNDLLSALPTDDKDEDDSQYTISAKPPSNLDDISRINTPNTCLTAPSTPNRGLPSREGTRTAMEVVAEEKESARSNIDPASLNASMNAGVTTAGDGPISVNAGVPLTVLPSGTPANGNDQGTVADVPASDDVKPGSTNTSMDVGEAANVEAAPATEPANGGNVNNQEQLNAEDVQDEKHGEINGDVDKSKNDGAGEQTKEVSGPNVADEQTKEVSGPTAGGEQTKEVSGPTAGGEQTKEVSGPIEEA